MADPVTRQPPLELLLRGLHALVGDEADLPDATTPLGRTTREFFRNNWDQARSGLLARTRKIRVRPIERSSPRTFRFEVDCRYRRRRGDDSPVELAEGPVRGTIKYRASLFDATPGEPTIVVFLDPDQGYFHPNYSRRHDVLCLGPIPPGPFPLEVLLQHLYSILTYQNRNSLDPADPVAAGYFDTDPGAMDGLDAPEPLY